MKFNMGDDYYNEHSDEYNFADEVGWIHIASGTVVEAHEGYETRNHRENREEDERMDRDEWRARKNRW